MGANSNKEKQKSILIDASVHTRLTAFCSKNNILIKDFIPLALDYFDKTGIDIRSDVKADVEEGIKSRLDKQDENAKALKEELSELRKLVGEQQGKVNQNVIDVLKGVVNSIQEQQAGQRKLLERTRPTKTTGHLWWKKEVPIDDDIQEAEEIHD
jgi:hypothetical protein